MTRRVNAAQYSAIYLQEDIAQVADLVGHSAQLLSGKTIVLTGSEGFLGIYFCALFQHLSDHVLQKPVRVLAFDNYIASAITEDQHPDFSCVTFRQHDVTQPLSIDGDVDYVLHAAGIASPVWYRTHPLETLDVSTLGTRAMLELAREKKARLMYFSSSEIYGDPMDHQVPTAEDCLGNVSCFGPRACYDEGKRVGETLCHIYHAKYGLPTIVVRPFNVYGPGMREYDYRVLPAFASRIKAGLPLEVFGNGGQTRTFCYVVDALAGFIQTLLHGIPGEAYNIGNPDPEISIAELAQRIRNILGGHVQFNIRDYPAGYPSNEPKRRCPNIGKAMRDVGYRPVVELDDGLRRFLTWADRTYTGTGDLELALTGTT